MKFERVPMSGALEYLKGDIFCPEMFTNFPYTIECKHYKELNFNSLLTAKSNDLWSFWKQAQEECEVMKVVNKTVKPLVVFRWDRSKNFAMWDSDINVAEQMTVKAFGNSVKIAELDKWLKKIKLT
jgi:hypothetical protein